MERDIIELQKLVDEINSFGESLSYEESIKLAVEIQRNRIIDGWLESISQVLNRIEGSIDQLPSQD